MSNIAFIGTGTMGGPLAGHLMAAGHTLSVHARTPSRAQGLVERGARWAATAAEAVRDAEVVFTMVGGPRDVEGLYFGEILDAAPHGALLIDMTTSSPRLAQRLHEAAATHGHQALDAPVTGGPQGAQAGALIVMVGGEADALQRARPLLDTFSRTVLHYGPAGNGQRAKLVNQCVAMQNMISAIEGLFFARRAGLDTDQMLQMLQAGLTDSKSLHGLAPLALRGEFPPNFHPVHVVKDLTLALEEADALGIDLPGLRNAHARWTQLVERFPEAKAVHEVARLYL
ncbi:NAD(P)-dependent oxidoreductase [Aquabacterium sp. J223]|uniref:NAD(P)-dependent oxidoreductase n=1 Tax=Aquabacterium sp. J223 TaxID=2898431 RepID=UPI0021ADF2A9|nr:NAD(P)-dependent oxidoreductase [Aquabacterium sp. J223]UUX94980.1 NAD(P)-dependent oxidoreductase [Aquabacterium sp. J223]